MAAIVVEDLHFEYPGVRALDGVSFTIEPGRVTALVGPNGAGKTTLLRCIAGLERPLHGRVLLDGVDVDEHPREAHRRVGWLSDSYGLYDGLPVARCLAWAAGAQGVGDNRLAAAVEATAERLDLVPLLDRPAALLSRGQRQRVAIGQAIVHGPPVLLLDEPASGLDPEARASLATLFRRLRDEGMTLLVSSHILAELDEYATEMLVLRGGRVVSHEVLGRAEPERRVAVRFAADPGPLPDLPGVRVARAGVDTLLVVEGDDLAGVLRALVGAGLPVVGFWEVRADLQTNYLRTVSQ